LRGTEMLIFLFWGAQAASLQRSAPCRTQHGSGKLPETNRL